MANDKVILPVIFILFFGLASACNDSSDCGELESCCADGLCRISCVCTDNSDCSVGECCSTSNYQCTTYDCDLTTGSVAGIIVGGVIFVSIISSIIACCFCACCPYYRYRNQGVVIVSAGQPPYQQFVSTTTTTSSAQQPMPGYCQQPPPYHVQPQASGYPPPQAHGQVVYPPQGMPMKHWTCSRSSVTFNDFIEHNSGINLS